MVKRRQSDSGVLLDALSDHAVKAQVIDVDHHRQRGLMVETDFIILVESTGAPTEKDEFFQYMISKTYRQFRKLATKLKLAADRYDNVSTLDESLSTDYHGGRNEFAPRRRGSAVAYTRAFCLELSSLIRSQSVNRLGKVNFVKVKQMSKQRTKLINGALQMIVDGFPRLETTSFCGVNRNSDQRSETFMSDVEDAIETFFLTDHVVEDSWHDSRVSVIPSKLSPPSLSPPGSPNGDESKANGQEIGDCRRASFVSPISNKRRKSLVDRENDVKVLDKLGREDALLIADEEDNSSCPDNDGHPLRLYDRSRKQGGVLLALIVFLCRLLKMAVFLALFASLVFALSFLSLSEVKLESDFALLLCFICFCLGRQADFFAALVCTERSEEDGSMDISFVSSKFTPNRRVTISHDALERAVEKATSSHSVIVAKTLRTSIMTEVVFDGTSPPINSPLAQYMDEDDVNCWSEPMAVDFLVRGSNYLVDKKKVPSGPFLFPLRGVDLFLTDDPPSNIGRNREVLGGALRDLPTFVVHFRLPWGSLVLYHEIPKKFLPFLRWRYKASLRHGDDAGDTACSNGERSPSMDGMTIGERTACKFLMGDDEHRKKTLKIIPKVVEGPRIVMSTMRGKPAIIGSKLPVIYTYQPGDSSAAEEEYFEADLDIAALSRARKILSLCRSCTQGLAVEVAFVVQGNTDGELPEQLLCGATLHKIDLLNASVLPAITDIDTTSISNSTSWSDED